MSKIAEIFGKKNEGIVINASDLIKQMEATKGLQYKLLVRKLKEHQADALAKKTEMHVTFQGHKGFKINGGIEIRDEYIIDGPKKESYLEYITKQVKFKGKDKKDIEDFKKLIKSEEVLKQIEEKDLISVAGPISMIVKFVPTPEVIQFVQYKVNLIA